MTISLDLFQQLSLSEVEQLTHEIDQAIDNHARWLNQLNRTLICQLPAREDDLAEQPHRLCQFGRWYHGIDNPVLEGLESFRRIRPVHELLHMIARDLLQKAARQETIPADLYDTLLMQTNNLRTHLYDLRSELNRNRELALRLMGKVFENADEGVIITAPDATIISVNKAFTEVTGYSADEAIGQTPSLLKSGRQESRFYHHMWDQLRTHGQWQGEIWNRNKKGEDYLAWLSIAAVKNEEGEISHYVAVFSDITSEKVSEERLRRLAHYDQLTGLPNRVLFNERLAYALSLAQRNRQKVAVMFLDLDGFKPVNDNLGHAAGDRLLQMVAQRIRESLRASDTVARFGGDEFTVILPAVDGPLSATQTAGKIVTQIAMPYELDGYSITITASIGISLYPDHATTTQELIQEADQAMYQAKRKGKNRYQYAEAPDSTEKGQGKRS